MVIPSGIPSQAGILTTVLPAQAGIHVRSNNMNPASVGMAERAAPG
jgi:hypothetical protein